MGRFTLEQTGLRRFRRVADGVVGFGFVTTDIGRPLACIAFPSGEPKKLEYQDLAGYGVEDLGEVETSEYVEPEPDLSGQPDQPDELNQTEPPVDPFVPVVDEAALIEYYLKEHGTSVTNKSVIEALKAKGVVVQSAQVTAAKDKLNAVPAE